MKGVILAGGFGSRLFPITKAVNKHLIPVFNKPMVFYPLSILIKFGITEIIIVVSEFDVSTFKKLLDDGKRWGINLIIVSDVKNRGPIQALKCAKKYIDEEPFWLIFGDTIIWGEELVRASENHQNSDSPVIFSYINSVVDEFGVVEINSKGEAISIIEKPINSLSKHIVPGCYLYNKNIFDVISQMENKNEVKNISSVNSWYLQQENISIISLPKKSNVFFDAGTIRGLTEASNWVKKFENSNKALVGSPEIEALNNHLLNRSQLLSLIEGYPQSAYKALLLDRIK